MKLQAFTLLCCIGLSVSDVINVYVQKVEDVDIGPSSYDQSDITACELISNNGTNFPIYKNGREVYRERKFYISNRCTIRINTLMESDQGTWELRITKKNSTIPEIFLYKINVKDVYHNKDYDAIPSSQVWVYPGQQVLTHFNQKVDNLESCLVLTPKKKEIDLGAGIAENIKLAGQCGFKMTVTEQTGEWTLIANLKNNSAFYKTVEILLNNEDHLKPNITYLSFKRGTSEIIRARTDAQNVKLCILEDPQGVRYGFQDGHCSKQIKEITKHHEGTWKAYYGFNGIENLIEHKIVVSTYDFSSMNSTVTHTQGGTHLLCRVRKSQMNYCAFTRPDGEIFQMTVGVGNENYAYYGKGIPSNSYDRDVVVDCGITIYKPKSVDYGSWRCLVKTGSSEKWGRILKVSSPARSNSEPVGNATDVYVKKGQPLEVNCKADDLLNYCWIRSPNGTVYNVKKNNKNANQGSGLEMGECKSVIKDEANITDTGKWSCHMGIENGPEIKADFQVFVEESYLTPVENIKIIENKDSEMVFKPLLQSGKIIDSCRWVSPHGQGINVEHEGRYLTEASSTQCKLSIRTIDFEEDVGEWTCYAQFQDGDEGKASTTLAVRGMGLTSFLSITVVISVLICSSIGIVVLVVYKRRVADAKRLDKQLILEKPPKYP